ncbi:acyl-CoA dehydrogenase family protein [Nocardia sp. NBC_01329]|uniref:acyl-CoA dehydrogenase family protein n=1 Tax=Nocardia sp. NBC_01329 TaxID=2903594 RepID=UPI002E146413|nr:acyl-CoA dehydrogenase family protein [Nocardia sp. NBC_01329]
MATTLLVPARAPDGTVQVAVVSSGAPGLRIDDRAVVDETRSLGRITAREVALAPDEVRPFLAGGDRGSRALYDRAALASACDSLGVGAAMLDATVEYAGVRAQFGRPIGSFQAVKHACADMFVELTIARRLVSEALSAPVDGSPESCRAVSAAKASAAAARVRGLEIEQIVDHAVRFLEAARFAETQGDINPVSDRDFRRSPGSEG